MYEPSVESRAKPSSHQPILMGILRARMQLKLPLNSTLTSFVAWKKWVKQHSLKYPTKSGEVNWPPRRHVSAVHGVINLPSSYWAWGKKALTSVFASLKISVESWAEPFNYFSSVWMGYNTQQSDRRSGYRKLLGVTSNKHELFWNGRNFTLMLTHTAACLWRQNQFSTTASSKKVSTNRCDINGQREIVMWPSNRKC